MDAINGRAFSNFTMRPTYRGNEDRGMCDHNMSSNIAATCNKIITIFGFDVVSQKSAIATTFGHFYMTLKEFSRSSNNGTIPSMN